MQTLAIVRAALAGLSAARAAPAQDFDGRLGVIGDEQHRPHDRPPLSREFLLASASAQDLYLESSEDELQAEWILAWPRPAWTRPRRPFNCPMAGRRLPTASSSPPASAAS
jgi:NADPH-dependent 2,4-dienoyl-CoA reductase/sulfur reductase-like enzyme